MFWRPACSTHSPIENVSRQGASRHRSTHQHRTCAMRSTSFCRSGQWSSHREMASSFIARVVTMRTTATSDTPRAQTASRYDMMMDRYRGMSISRGTRSLSKKASGCRRGRSSHEAETRAMRPIRIFILRSMIGTGRMFVLHSETHCPKRSHTVHACPLTESRSTSGIFVSLVSPTNLA